MKSTQAAVISETKGFFDQSGGRGRGRGKGREREGEGRRTVRIRWEGEGERGEGEREGSVPFLPSDSINNEINIG